MGKPDLLFGTLLRVSALTFIPLDEDLCAFNQGLVLSSFKATKGLQNKLIQQRCEILVGSAELLGDLDPLPQHLIREKLVLKLESSCLSSFPIFAILPTLMSIIDALPDDLQWIELSQKVPASW